MQLAGISESFFLADHGDALQSRVVSHRLPLVVPLLESSLKPECSEEICDMARLKNSQVKFQIKCLMGAECAVFHAAVAYQLHCSEQSG